MGKKLRIILMGEKEESHARAALLTKHGYEVDVVPTIQLIPMKLRAHEIRALKQLLKYDYILFTSAHAVHFFMKALKKYRIKKPQQLQRIIAVGPATARACRSLNFPVWRMPKRFTAEDMATELGDIDERKILFPRSARAPHDTLTNLRTRGAQVTVVLLYTPRAVPISRPCMEKLFKRPIDYLIIMSGSSIESFSKNLPKGMLERKAHTTPLLCIGPRTAETASRLGFRKISIADTFTMQGIRRTLRNVS